MQLLPFKRLGKQLIEQITMWARCDSRTPKKL